VSNSVADQQQREVALDPLRSFCVSAPAGSGKTELLIQRFLTLLARVEYPEQLLAITFTRKAAAEMRARIAEALNAARDTPCPEDAHSACTRRLARDVLRQDLERAWHLDKNPARLNIKTIDSYCAGLTRQMPVLSRFGASVSPVDDSGPLYRAATRSLRDLLGTNHPVAADLHRVLLQFDGNWARLEDLMTRMLACRDQWLVYMGTGFSSDTAEEVLQRSLILVIEDALHELESRLGSYADELEELYAYSRSQLDGGREYSLPGLEAGDLPAWQSLVNMLLTASGEWRKRVDKNTGFPAGKGETAARKEQMQALLQDMQSSEGLIDVLRHIRSLPSRQPGSEQWELVLAVSRLLPTLAAQLSLEFQQQGRVDHTHIAMAALDALGSDDSPTDLALKLDYQLSHILVDEFQDTSISQYELIRRLTRGWSEYNRANPLNPRSIFIVGDGMQSIYGFRNADVGLFVLARRHGFNGVSLEPIELKSNFRSDATLVEWVNQTFSAAFPLRDDIRRGEVRFSSAWPQQAAAEDRAVTLCAFTDTELSAIQAEAAWVAEQVAQGLADDGCRSIAILVRARSHLLPVVAELKRRGLAWQAQDIDLLANSLLVRDLQTLCRALHNEADRVAWLALLRAPWSGLDLSSLLHIARAAAGRSIWATLQDPATPAGLAARARERTEQLVNVLVRAMQRRERLGLRDWIESTWLDLGGPGCAETSAQLADAVEFLDLLEDRDNSGQAWDDALVSEQVAQLYASAGATDSKLQLMTLHKAKGLEFDWVFIPGLARAPAAEQRELLLWNEFHSANEQDSGFLLAVDDGDSGKESPLYNYLHEQKKLKRQRESTRLLYVGATRAAKRLFLSACLQAGEGEAEQEWKPPSARSLLSCIWDSFAAQMETPLLPPVAGRESPLAMPLMRISATLRQCTPGQVGGTGSESSTANIPAPPGDMLSSYIGTVIHHTLQRLAGRSEPELKAVDTAGYRDWWRLRLANLRVPESLIEQALERIEDSVCKTLGDERGRWLLSVEREEAHSEWCLSSLRDDGRLAEHIIDRSYVHDDVRWIVDYKSSFPDSGQSMSVFLDLEREKYAPQLQRYRELLQGMEKRPVRTALYFTALPQWLEVD
jgi:ATP-dependent exoDNAse (exonuclease V) beta subunit